MPETITSSDMLDSVRTIQESGYTLEELFARKEEFFTPEELEQVYIDCVNEGPGSENHTLMWQYGLAAMLVQKQKEKYEQAMKNKIK